MEKSRDREWKEKKKRKGNKDEQPKKLIWLNVTRLQ